MVIDRIYEWARVEPSKAALIHDDEIIDYITYAKYIETFRKILERHDLPAGTIAIVLVNHLADAWGLGMALRSVGLTTIHVQSLAQAKALGIKNISCAVTTAREQSVHGLAGKPLDGVELIVISRRDFAATPLLELPLSPQSNRPSGGHILYTSGTTGAFKKLMWHSDLEDARTSARSRAHSFYKSTVAHTGAFGQWTSIGWKVPLSVWQTGGCVVFDQRPDCYERFFRHAITTAFLIPSSFRKLVDATASKTDGCEILLSSGFVGSETIGKAIAKFGDCLSNYYGSSELITPPLITRIRSQDDALWLEPAVGRTVEIVDDNGHECSSGQEGDLRILRTKLDWHCYLDDEQATSKVFRDGFFYPGDRAVRRADGRIRILGRAADVLNVQGQKIGVGPIEQRIQQYLEVDEVCVFSGLNAAGQVELVIAIKSDNEPSKEKLDSISQEFANFDKVSFSVLSEFPRTETGTRKVRRAELRKVVFSEPVASKN